MLARQFEMTYIDKDGEKKYPYIIHRTSLGCYERTMALLLEKFAGALPMWLSPEQIRVLPIGDGQLDFAKQVMAKLRSAGLRVELDDRREKIGYKIREAQVEKLSLIHILSYRRDFNDRQREV